MINIGKDWFINHDGISFSVQKKQYIASGKNKGEITWTNQTWHSSYQMVKKKVADIALGEAIENGDLVMVFDMLDNFVLQSKEIKKLKK